jgi:hypothetical protein
MPDSWTELWSFGVGRSRIYCGIARTEEGFAVDVFCGDWCIESEPHRTRAVAVRAALARERRYQHRRPQNVPLYPNQDEPARESSIQTRVAGQGGCT